MEVQPTAAAEAAPTPPAAPAPGRPAPLWRRLAHSQGLRLFGLVVLAGVLLVQGIEALGGAAGIRERFGPAAGLLLVPVQIVVSASPVPGELVAAVSVAIYGFWVGAALSWLGWFGASFLEYGLVRMTTREITADPAALERLPAFLRRFPVDHPAFLILTRFLPFGAHIVNVAAGIHGVPLFRFAWTAAVALVVTALFFSALVTGLIAS